MTDNIHGIILAGGISSRMGYPKALLPFGESFFLHAVYAGMAGAGARPIHIVVNAGLRVLLTPEIERFPEASFVTNEETQLGQIHSLKLGLRAAQTIDAHGALVGLVDLPRVLPTTYRALLDRVNTSPGRIIIPRHNGHHGHPYILPGTLFPAFLEAPPELTGRDVMHSLQEHVEYLDVDDPHVLRDIDSPADLR